MTAAILLAGLVIELAIGWPDRLYHLIGHPVSWMGRAISVLERVLNRQYLNQHAFSPQTRKLCGMLTVVLLVSGSFIAAWGLQYLIVNTIDESLLQLAVMAIVAWPFLAARSLYQHVDRVNQPLAKGDITDARLALSHIVGRETKDLDQAAITRGALESLAENFSDAVIAPLFWGLIFGLPGLVGYKMINTLDSMVGYKNDRYQDFGWAAARLDDLANFIPARISALILLLVAPRHFAKIRHLPQQARHHASPNAGWPEAAMALVLNVRLAGPRTYGQRIQQDPWINHSGHDPDVSDLKKGLRLYRFSIALLLVLLTGLMLVDALNLS